MTYPPALTEHVIAQARERDAKQPPREWWSAQPEPICTILDFCATRGGDVHAEIWDRVVALFCPTLAAGLVTVAECIADAARFRSGELHPEDDERGVAGAERAEGDALVDAQLLAGAFARGER